MRASSSSVSLARTSSRSHYQTFLNHSPLLTNQIQPPYRTLFTTFPLSAPSHHKQSGGGKKRAKRVFENAPKYQPEPPDHDPSSSTSEPVLAEEDKPLKQRLEEGAEVMMKERDGKIHRTRRNKPQPRADALKSRSSQDKHKKTSGFASIDVLTQELKTLWKVYIYSTSLT